MDAWSTHEWYRCGMASVTDTRLTSAKLCSLIVQHRLITRCSPGMAGAQIDRALVVLPMRVNERCWGWARCVLVRCSRVWCCLYVSLRALFTCFPDIFGVTCNCCCCCCWRCCLLPLHPTKYVYLFRLIVLPFIPFIFGPSKISPQYIVRLREWSMRSQRSYPHESTYTKQIHSNDHTHSVKYENKLNCIGWLSFIN